MGNKSSIARLDPRIQEAVEAAVRGGKTIDEIVSLIHGMGAEASRSAVGRYAKRAAARMEHYRQAQEIAKVWIAKMHEEPEGDVGRLAIEMVRTAAFQQLADMGEGEGEAGPMEVMLLAKALDHASRSQKVDLDRALRARKEFAAEAAKKTEELAKSRGLSAETVDMIKSQILGIE